MTKTAVDSETLAVTGGYYGGGCHTKNKRLEEEF